MNDAPAVLVVCDAGPLIHLDELAPALIEGLELRLHATPASGVMSLLTSTTTNTRRDSECVARAARSFDVACQT